MMYVAIGAPFGAMLRYLISQQANKDFPYGTLLINLIGSYILGLISHLSETYLLLIGVGFLGSFTTFSTLNIELLQLFKDKLHKGLLYLALTYILGPILFYFAYSFQF